MESSKKISHQYQKINYVNSNAELAEHILDEENLHQIDQSKSMMEQTTTQKSFEFENSAFITHGLMVMSGLFSGLGNSLDSVSILAWMSIMLLVIGIDTGLKLQNQRVVLLLNILFSQSLGFCLGFSSLFGYPTEDALSVLTSFGAGLLFYLIVLFLSIIPHIVWNEIYPHDMRTSLILPTTYTTAVCTLIGSIFSTMISIGNASLDYEPLRQVASLFGITAINFLFVYSATCAAYLISDLFSIQRRSNLKNYFLIISSIYLTIFVITGLIYRSNSFYQKNVSELISPRISVSCVYSQNALLGSTLAYQLWNSTESRVLAGDSIVLQSEEAMKIVSDDEEQYIIQLGQQIASLNRNKTVFVGISYMKQLTGDNLATNHFALVTADTVAWNYRKAYPVPLIESNVEPGPKILPTYDSPYGKLGGGICFDLDYPQYIWQAGAKKVDILLEPSWTWTAINFRHFEGNAVRSIENGMNLFRCSSEGESGIVLSNGKFVARTETGDNPISDTVTYSMPLFPRSDTLFTSFGFIFEWLLLPFSLIYIVFAYLPQSIRGSEQMKQFLSTMRL